MAYSEAGIEARGFREGASLVVEWSSAAPAGTVFQVYLDRRRAWAGPGRRAVLPHPLEVASVRVGSVGAGEADLDFSGDLPAGPETRARLAWEGGTHLKASIAGYRIYQGLTPGGAVDYTSPIATVPAYGALTTSGANMGGANQGTANNASASYTWTSGPLASGTWNFGVRPYDLAGNEGDEVEDAVVIEAPPRPPAANASGARLTYTYNGTTHVATLGWLASPSA